MEIIVSLDENNGIGKDGDLLAHLSPDLRRLRAMTVGNIIVMGSKTYLSFPRRPLPDRENLVLTSHPEDFPEVKCFTSLDEFLEYAKTADKPIFVLGGSNVYKQLLPYCDKLHVTRILHSFEADTFFPDPDKLEGWTKTAEGEIIDTEQYPFRYDEYEKTQS
ncbi:MAG: dihydrofolate reductase [Eubacterium sp.]|nr:dihydrofolate reductase [Eubacterium sp.]